jgi:hypothetical protein
MKTITLSELLKLMSIETYHKLRARGRIVEVRKAPYAEIEVETLPDLIQAALSRLPTA